MRQKRTVQSSIFDQFGEHEIGRELSAISALLDEHREILDWVAGDLRPGPVSRRGRRGLPAESVLRCAVLKQSRQWTYEELSFHLMDSAVCQAFARLPRGWAPRKSALQQTIGAISDSTWERLSGQVLKQAKEENIERGEVVRIDSTVTATPIHEPSDSSLLFDAVRVILRLLEQARGYHPAVTFTSHRRLAKRRVRAIQYCRGKEKRRGLYRDLLGAVDKMLGYLSQAQCRLAGNGSARDWHVRVARERALIQQVIDQTRRRVLQGESVPAEDKIVSLFEPHTDIIVKGGREVHYGHKLNLTCGRSGLVLDLVIEDGNPADSERFLPMLQRHLERWGEPPRQMAADGGYASGSNLSDAKQLGCQAVAFHKKCGLAIEEMTGSASLYRQLIRFRAGIESVISCLKRAYGLARSTWKGLGGFRAFVWSAVVSYNLVHFARLRAP